MIDKQKVEHLVNKLKIDIKYELKKNNIEMALELIYTCANVLYQTNIYYVDDELENYIKLISEKISLVGFKQSENHKLLFYDGFGLNDRGLAYIYLNAICKYRDVVYVTYDDRKNSIPDLLKIIYKGKSNKVYFIKRDNKRFSNQIMDLNKIMNEEKPCEFFFYSTPNDVVGTVILNFYREGVKRYQINLTDHAFWLGARCIDKCIEFRDYGASISKKYRLISEDSIVKLPFYPETHPEREFQGFPFELKKEQKVIFSGGSLYKTLGGENKYYKIVDYILSKHDDIVFWYAGRGDNRELRKIIDRFPGRAYHTEERSDLFQILKKSRFYLSTYPICGGLMYQFAASAGKVPVTLKYGEDTEGFLINQNLLGIEFDNLNELYLEIDRLIINDKYCESRSKEMKKTVLSKDDFTNYLKSILEDEKNNLLNIEYADIKTDDFRNEYLTRLNEDDLNSFLVSKRTLKSSLKYNFAKTIIGGVTKLKRKLL